MKTMRPFNRVPMAPPAGTVFPPHRTRRAWRTIRPKVAIIRYNPKWKGKETHHRLLFSFHRPPDEQNLRHHIFHFIKQGTPMLLFPPVQLFHIGAAMGQLVGRLMLDGIDLPADMNGKGQLPVNPVTGCKDKHQNAQIRQCIKSHGTFPLLKLACGQGSVFLPEKWVLKQILPGPVSDGGKR